MRIHICTRIYNPLVVLYVGFHASHSGDLIWYPSFVSPLQAKVATRLRRVQVVCNVGRLVTGVCLSSTFTCSVYRYSPATVSTSRAQLSTWCIRIDLQQCPPLECCQVHDVLISTCNCGNNHRPFALPWTSDHKRTFYHNSTPTQVS